MCSLLPANSVLALINNPQDLKSLTYQTLDKLSHEIRQYILSVVSANGGHLASNLGAVELTIALHRVFDSPLDKIIWDVGHQCYTHKILTGRKEAFPSIRKKDGLSGFPKRAESPHDFVETGHSSTSISIGIGLLTGQHLSKEKGKVIAVVGDGALTGGMALEGLNYTGHTQKNLIVVLNDNKMSINQNVGALSFYFSRITATRAYQLFQKNFDALVKRLPVVGQGIFNFAIRIKKGIKALLFRENLFSDFGFEYIGPVNGHNIKQLVQVFQAVRGLRKPVVVHVVTTKGKGYKHAEGNPSLYHGVGSFSIGDGKLASKQQISFTQAFTDALLPLAAKNKEVVAVTAAMADGTGLAPFRDRFPNRFFDVGITEQHALGFAAGLAHKGLRPVVAIYSTFMQRAVDQLIHDIALPGLPVVIAMDRAGLVGADGETHQGVFDIPLFKSIPGISFLAPADGQEMKLCLAYALKSKQPVLLRYPRDYCLLDLAALGQPLVNGRGVLLKSPLENASEKSPDGRPRCLILTLGGTLREAVQASKLLTHKKLTVDVYNLRFIKPLDKTYLISLLNNYNTAIMLEDGVVEGGLGETIAALLAQVRSETNFKVFGVTNAFTPHASRDELLETFGMKSQQLAKIIENLIIKKKPLIQQSLLQLSHF
jgi:1-deoxy-D-xylulose-5-phosphate synthase